MKRFLIVTLIGLLPNIGLATSMQSQGYVRVNPQLSSDQIDILSVNIGIRFPRTIKTTGEAIQFLLKRSGYSMATGENIDPKMKILMSHRLPQIHRKFEHVQLRDALKALAGESWVLVEDPINRLISFDAKKFNGIVRARDEVK